MKFAKSFIVLFTVLTGFAAAIPTDAHGTPAPTPGKDVGRGRETGKPGRERMPSMPGEGKVRDFISRVFLQ